MFTPSRSFLLNITVDDLECGRYESSKKIIVDRLVNRRAILNDYGKNPPVLLRTPLLELMVDECDREGIVVVRAPSGYGKTTAAKFILKNAPGGLMFRNCNTDITTYGAGMAEALGVPKEVYEKTVKWRNLLVEAVAEVPSTDRQDGSTGTKSWMNHPRVTKLMGGIISFCGGPDDSDDMNDLLDDSGPCDTDIERLSLDKLKNREKGILILDDFNLVEQKDIKFMKHFYGIADGEGILVFVLVRDIDTADKLLAQNGWNRLFPLTGICRDKNGLPIGEDGKEPEWSKPDWTKEVLTKFLRSNVEEITDEQVRRLDIKDGDLPNDLLHRARRMLREARKHL